MRQLLPIPAARKISFCCNQDGFALPLVLIIMTLILTFSASLLSLMTLSMRESSTYLNYQRAVLSGKNAQEICKAKLSSNLSYTGTAGWEVQDDGSTYSIKVQTISEFRRFVSIKIILGEYGRYYEGEAALDPANGSIAEWSLHLKRWNGNSE